VQYITINVIDNKFRPKFIFNISFYKQKNKIVQKQLKYFLYFYSALEMRKKIGDNIEYNC